jgi:hypothetical protein
MSSPVHNGPAAHSSRQLRSRWCHLRGVTLGLLVLCVALSSQPLHADATDVACTAGLFGACLGSLSDKLRALVESFENSGKALEAGLGAQIATNVSLARAQLDAELNKQMSQVSATASNFVASTLSQVHRLEAQTFKDAKSLSTDILTAASAIPFSHREPSVRPLANPYYVPLDAGSLQVRIDGHFLDIGKSGYDATLRVGDAPTTYAHSENSTDHLQFSVPYSALARTTADNVVDYKRLTVSVPYHKSGFCLFWCKGTETFKLTLITLPRNPGTLVVTKHKQVPDVDTKPVTSPEQFQDSKDNDITEDKTGKLYCFAPADAGTGWRIQPSSVKGRVTWVFEGEQGTDWWWVSNPDSATSQADACVRMETLHKNFGHSGKVKFVVDYTEEHDKLTNVDTPVQIDRPWGGSQLVNLSQGESWTGRFVQFDGRVYEFHDGDIESPFVRIDPGTLSVTVAFVAQNP